jgi:hypothetical protein
MEFAQWLTQVHKKLQESPSSINLSQTSSFGTLCNGSFISAEVAFMTTPGCITVTDFKAIPPAD